MKIDPNKPFFELDFGGDRFTHYPSGDTCLRHRWMRGHKHLAWAEKFREFVASHPDCHVVASSRYEVIDDIRRHALLGGGFTVGETVVLLGMPREVLFAVQVAEEVTMSNPVMLEDGHPTHYILETGDILYWDSDTNGWMTSNRREANHRARVRPLFAGENAEDLLTSSKTFLADYLTPLILDIQRKAPQMTNVIDNLKRFQLAIFLNHDEDFSQNAVNALREAGADLAVVPDEGRNRYWNDDLPRRSLMLADAVERRLSMEAAAAPAAAYR